MRVRLLLFYVIYQTVITASLGGVILPFSDSIGKVIPIKPKPLPASTVSTSISPSSSPKCDRKDDQKLLSSLAKGPVFQEFSSPLSIMSLSRALPVPKVNSTSIKNVKIPERLREQFLALRKGPLRYTKTVISPPELSLSNKNSFLSSPSKFPDALCTYAPSEIDKLRSVTSVPDLAVESSKTSGTDLSKTSQFSSLDGVNFPFSDSIGKVTPLKPKSLPVPTVSSSITSSSTPICNSKDTPKLYSPTGKRLISGEFSSPIVITSSSRALPIPKTDSTSINNVKIPDRLREKFLVQSKCPVRYTAPDIYSPEVSLPNKNPFLSSPSNLPGALRTYSPSEIHKLFPLPSVKSLPDLAVKPSKTSCINLSKTSQFSPLGEVTLPFSDSIGKVTPIKPKPLPKSTVLPSITLSSSPICHSKDNSIPVPTAAKGPTSQGFSSPIVLTSSSKALPVPKIDSSSIENVEMTDKLRGKFLTLCEGSVENAKPNIRSPEASLANKSPFLLPPSNLSEVDKQFPLLSIKTFPDISAKSLESPGQFSVPVSETLLPKSRICESPSTFAAEKSTFSENLIEKTFSWPSPYPLLYKSRCLPRVKTSSESLSYRPFYYKETGNFDSLPTLSSGNSPNFLSYTNEPYVLSYLDTIKSLQIPKSNNPIQLPKTPTNIPISSHTVTLAPDAVTKNLWPLKELNAVSTPVAFESNLESASSSISLRNEYNLQDDRTLEFKLKPGSPTSPSNYFHSPATPLMPIPILSPNFDMLSNKMSSCDCSKSITPKILPSIGMCTETIENMDPNDLSDCQTSFDSKNVPNLEIVNFSSPSPNEHPTFTKECIVKPIKHSLPVIPNESIPIIFSSIPLSPIVYCPSAISQTPTNPVSCLNRSNPSSISEATSNMLSSITNLLSNITQNILSPFKPYSALQNKHQIPTHIMESYPYTDTLKRPEQSLPVLTVQECKPVNSISLLPVVSAPTVCINERNTKPSNIESLDPPLAFKISPIQPLFISSLQFTTPALSPTSLITYVTPPLCPSYLPTPILPSYPAIASPFHMETPVYKEKSSKKDSDVEKIIDLMLLTEILNDDESFDWDDLDTLLELLSLN